MNNGTETERGTSLSRRHFIAAGAGLVASLTSGSAFAKGGNKYGAVPEREKGLVFLFQGDSITDGNWGQAGSSRRSLNDGNHILGHGYVFAVASRIGADFPQAGFTFHNRGVSGNKASNLEQRWEKDTLALKPDVLSILIGVNDVWEVLKNTPESYGADVYEETYRSLLRRTKEANPDTLFVLGTPFMYPKENREFWNREIPVRVNIVKKLAVEFDAVLVDYIGMFEKATKSAPIEHWVWDGCHPSVFGHELMAREWIRQTATRLKFLKKYKY
jgi:lysophospholipase L1-like esterase